MDHVVTPGRFARPTAPISDGVITLRTFDLSDVALVTQYCQDPEISRWTTVPSPYDESHAHTWISAHDDQWDRGLEAALAITDATNGTLLGSVGLFRDLSDETVAEVGYWVGAPARGRGHAVRAVQLVCAWGAVTAQLRQLQLFTLLGNTNSERVAVKAGFDRVGEVLDYRSERRPDVGVDVTVWQRTVR